MALLVPLAGLITTVASGLDARADSRPPPQTPQTLPSPPTPQAKPGGDTTVAATGRQAFSLPAANLDAEALARFASGSLLFRRDWLPAHVAGAAPLAIGLGLGPYFNERSCSACHTLDGRGAPHAAGDLNRRLITTQPFALVFRLAMPGPDGTTRPDPVYGSQFSNAAVAGAQPEGQVHIRYTEKPGRFADGTAYSLRQPRYHFTQLSHGPMQRQTVVSPRIAPHLPGVGLLDAISQGDLEQNARDQLRRPDTIKGVVSQVIDPFAGQVAGRFGWKASTGSLQHQTASALHADMGITSEHFAREDCTARQRDCVPVQTGRASAAGVDIDNDTLGQIVTYQATLAVPARRGMDDLDVRRGEALFTQAHCSVCHRPAYTTAKGYGPALSRQRIYPYTDLLLHDMGQALADTDWRGRPPASGTHQASLWRTPPLWGIGLIPAVNGHPFLLHDGRARGTLEAILWHGGEAEGSRQKVLAMNRNEREALVRFVNSL